MAMVRLLLLLDPTPTKTKRRMAPDTIFVAEEDDDLLDTTIDIVQDVDSPSWKTKAMVPLLDTDPEPNTAAQLFGFLGSVTLVRYLYVPAAGQYLPFFEVNFLILPLLYWPFLQIFVCPSNTLAPKA